MRNENDENRKPGLRLVSRSGERPRQPRVVRGARRAGDGGEGPVRPAARRLRPAPGERRRRAYRRPAVVALRRPPRAAAGGASRAAPPHPPRGVPHPGAARRAREDGGLPMSAVTFTVRGLAQPKGSAKAYVPKAWAVAAVATGRAPRAIVTHDNPKAKGWQQLVAEQAQAAASHDYFAGPVVLTVAFYLARPKRRVTDHVT